MRSINIDAMNILVAELVEEIKEEVEFGPKSKRKRLRQVR